MSLNQLFPFLLFPFPSNQIIEGDMQLQLQPEPDIILEDEPVIVLDEEPVIVVDDEIEVEVDG